MVFFFTNHSYVSKSILCVSIDVHFIFVQIFACQMSKTYKNFVKITHCCSSLWNSKSTWKDLHRRYLETNVLKGELPSLDKSIPSASVAACQGRSQLEASISETLHRSEQKVKPYKILSILHLHQSLAWSPARSPSRTSALRYRGDGCIYVAQSNGNPFASDSILYCQVEGSSLNE